MRLQIVTPLTDMTITELKEVVMALERKAEGLPENLDGRTREWLIEYVMALRPLRREKIPRIRILKRKEGRMAKNLGIGKFCVKLLTKVIGHTKDKQPIGLSYAKMVYIVQKKFPDSAADERHLRWYATTARSKGIDMPVYRERSRWVQ